VAERRDQAAAEVRRLERAGRKVWPVLIEGRKMAKSFWGAAWCRNLEAYSDFANRLPRGRTYVRNGSVVDLQIGAGKVRSLVSGSEVYTVTISVAPLASARWESIKRECSGAIGSLVELLQGKLSKGVMAVVTAKDSGLFPAPSDIELSCSCPDWATMCKHVAATLYGVGARLDDTPELLFTLRGVGPEELVEAAVQQGAPARRGRRRPALAADDLSSVFGVDILEEAPQKSKTTAAKSTKAKRSKTTAAKSTKAKRSKTIAAKSATPKKPKTTAAKSTQAKRSKTTAATSRRAKPPAQRRTTKRPTEADPALTASPAEAHSEPRSPSPLPPVVAKDPPTATIVTWLRSDGGWRTKAQILTATGVGPSLWSFSQRLMQRSGLVERRGVRYRAL